MIKKLRKDWFNIVLFTIAIILASMNFNLLLKPVNVVAGGAGGLALVLSNIFHMSTSNLITIIYIVTVILSAIFLDKKTFISILYASILYPLVTYLTEDITYFVSLNYGDVFLICIASGVISGITNGIAFRFGYAPGGLSIIAPIINKYFKVSLSTINFIVNTIVVLLGAYYYGFNMVIYAIVLLYISSYISNMVILGLSTNKVLFIKSKKNDKIIELLHDKYMVNAIVLDNDNKEKSLIAVVNNSDYGPVKKDILNIDQKVFFSTNDCYEVGK